MRSGSTGGSGPRRRRRAHAGRAGRPVPGRARRRRPPAPSRCHDRTTRAGCSRRRGTRRRPRPGTRRRTSPWYCDVGPPWMFSSSGTDPSAASANPSGRTLQASMSTPSRSYDQASVGATATASRNVAPKVVTGVVSPVATVTIARSPGVTGSVQQTAIRSPSGCTSAPVAARSRGNRSVSWPSPRWDQPDGPAVLERRDEPGASRQEPRPRRTERRRRRGDVAVEVTGQVVQGDVAVEVAGDAERAVDAGPVERVRRAGEVHRPVGGDGDRAPRPHRTARHRAGPDGDLDDLLVRVGRSGVVGPGHGQHRGAVGGPRRQGHVVGQVGERRDLHLGGRVDRPVARRGHEPQLLSPVVQPPLGVGAVRQPGQPRGAATALVAGEARELLGPGRPDEHEPPTVG